MIYKKIKNTYFLIALSAGSIFSCQSCSSGKEVEEPIIVPPTPVVVVDKNWAFETTPFWADEFDYTGLPETAKWDYDLGGSGWGNNEKEYYTNSLANASVADGKLSITAKKESMNGMAYTSARLVTRNKLDVLYGRIEVSAKLPTGKGTWPAIWMLPTDRAYGDWPKSGEIDIMEHVGYDQNNVHFTTHTEAYYFKINTQKTSTKTIADASTAFHKYRVDWTPYAIRGYYDDAMVFEFANEGTGYKVWPFDKRFHLLLNLAIGGDWGGAQGIDDTIFPQKMEIDYVRYYKMIEK
ncbi:glycoside hydrolase family 16 protein [Pedobacter boryungensis]|uniref:Glycoside hydrolase family 16 protein n=1 Tax=Pedobacter boryungensis TaxID=869962 RepID=A0ABX2DB53_9SPHI|nr:glycoside hydrolase family 16 protein [Pedobacter boryungensis]NQX30668.1 glycoside hydrolase family 16 protein [Pedobacter boryungensis]